MARTAGKLPVQKHKAEANFTVATERDPHGC